MYLCDIKVRKKGMRPRRKITVYQWDIDRKSLYIEKKEEAVPSGACCQHLFLVPSIRWLQTSLPSLENRTGPRLCKRVRTRTRKRSRPSCLSMDVVHALQSSAVMGRKAEVQRALLEKLMGPEGKYCCIQFCICLSFQQPWAFRRNSFILPTRRFARTFSAAHVPMIFLAIR